MTKSAFNVLSILAGAAIMYALDPERGRRRRAIARDKLVRSAHAAADAAGATAEDVKNRTYGTYAAARSSLAGDREVSEEKLTARVRSELGRYVSHSHAITVDAREGLVRLRGPVSAREQKRAVRAVSRVAGVKEVDDRLTIVDEEDRSGARERSGPRPELWKENWSPATRLLSSIAGTLLGLYGARRRGIAGFGMSTLGLGLLARAATNLETKRLTGVGAGHRAVDVRKSVYVDAPEEQVFAIWSAYENFPHFMSNVREVRDLGDGRSHWTVAGPAGVPIEWTAVITEYLPPELIAWRSEKGSAVAQSGMIRFQPDGDGTRVHVHLSYNPPAGAIGHAIAKLFGADPKAEIDADLMRMKSFVETGRQPHDAAQARA